MLHILDFQIYFFSYLNQIWVVLLSLVTCKRVLIIYCRNIPVSTHANLNRELWLFVHSLFTIKWIKKKNIKQVNFFFFLLANHIPRVKWMLVIRNRTWGADTQQHIVQWVVKYPSLPWMVLVYACYPMKKILIASLLLLKVFGFGIKSYSFIIWRDYT